MDLATEVDLQSEEIIIPSIRKAVSGTGRRHVFVGEESAFLTGTNELTDECTWFVDGIDGTTNFIHGYPFVTVGLNSFIFSIGHLFINRIIRPFTSGLISIFYLFIQIL